MCVGPLCWVVCRIRKRMYMYIMLQPVQYCIHTCIQHTCLANDIYVHSANARNGCSEIARTRKPLLGLPRRACRDDSSEWTPRTGLARLCLRSTPGHRKGICLSVFCAVGDNAASGRGGWIGSSCARSPASDATCCRTLKEAGGRAGGREP